MSNNRLRLDGLEELRAALRDLPKALQAEAEEIVFESANEAADDLRAGYAGHGDLADQVEVQQLKGGSAFAGSIVTNKSKLAYIFENGTQVRHTSIGANRGLIRPMHVFIPAVIKRRAEMYDRLRVMLQDHGMKVVG